MAEDQQERTEESTAKRREDFRRKGQVAQSREVHTAALMTSFLILWFFYVPIFWRQMQSLVGGLMRQAGTAEVTPAAVVELFLLLVGKMALLLAPLLVLVVVVGTFSSIAQIGFLLTGKPLQPDFTRLDPIKGVGRFFSRRALVELVKSLTKVLLIAVVAYKAIAANFAEGLLLIDLPPAATAAFLGRTAFKVLLQTSLVLILLGLLDLLFVRWEMEQKMKMTKQEQKEEHKETEGDPQIKGRIRAIQSQLARKRMMAEVPKADVVITNPTHFSVAIRYQRGEMDAPQVVAKGADAVALKIREIAREHGVPVVEDPPVARALFKVELGKMIPEEMFKAVAEILAYIYSLKGRKG